MSSRTSPLHQAVTSGDTNTVSAILAEGADVNATNDAGQTPLILAVVAGRYQHLRILLKAGANPLLRDNTGLSAIDWAERKGEIELAQLLAKHSQSSDASADAAKLQGDERKKTLPPVEEAARVPLSAEERTRRFIAGLKQRLDEKASQGPGAPEEKEPTISAKNDELPHTLPERVEPMGPTSEPPIEPLPVNTQEAAASELISDPFTADQVQPPPEQLPGQKYRKAVKATSEKLVPEFITKVDVTIPTDEPVARSVSSQKPILGSLRRKRCPQCGTVYNSELLAYCSYDSAALVDADQPIVTPQATNTSPLLWLMILVVLALGAVAGLVVTNSLLRLRDSKTQPVAATQPLPPQKGIAVAGGHLAGKETSLPEAVVPANTVNQPASVTVKVRIDRAGRVFWAEGEDGDQLLRDAAVAAAKKSTFSVEKLRGRGAEGTITYTFK